MAALHFCLCVLALALGGCAALRSRPQPTDSFKEFEAVLNSSVLDALSSPGAPRPKCWDTGFALVANSQQAVTHACMRGSGFALLTSLFVPANNIMGNEHSRELYAALLVNLANPLIDDVHVLFEVGDSDGCGKLPSVLERYAPAGVNVQQHFDKLTCKQVAKQPTYREFFGYASTFMRDRDVLLANTDIVFDETLNRLERPIDQHRAHVISVHPPPYSSQYKSIFGAECNSEPRCILPLKNATWKWLGYSWDVYAFRSPLPSSFDYSKVNHRMNIIGAENAMGYELEKTAGLKLSNPCWLVNAFHWHCIGGKMHPFDDPLRGHWLHRIARVMPCYDCPGVSPIAWCSKGFLVDLRADSAGLFKTPETVKACVDGPQGKMTLSGRLHDGKLGACRGAYDVNCLVIHGERVRHGVY